MQPVSYQVHRHQQVQPGDVVGPASARDNAVARYDGTTGKLIQNSNLSVLDGNANTLLVGAFDWRFLHANSTSGHLFLG